MGFSDRYIAKLWNLTETEVYSKRKQHGITPVFRMVDTLHTGKYIAYLYSSYTGKNDSILTEKKKIVVLGAGPIRIGQGVEFDYSTVHAVQTIRATATRPSSSTTTRRPSRRTTPRRTSSISSR